MSTDRNHAPDFAILVMGVARTISDRLNHAVAVAGIEDMRAPYGFVIRALATRDRTLTELAQLLDVTKQAAIKIVDEMDARGYVERTADPGDGRAKRLRLTPKAERVRQIALSTSGEMEAELRHHVGAENAKAMREALIAFLEANGTAADAMAGRSRAVW
jgi:DNA-binding MarR family transcriptional regulator